MNSINKRYSKIDQNLARDFKYNGACLSSPPPFLCSQKITHFHFNYLYQSGNRVVILANCVVMINKWLSNTYRSNTLPKIGQLKKHC